MWGCGDVGSRLSGSRGWRIGLVPGGPGSMATMSGSRSWPRPFRSGPRPSRIGRIGCWPRISPQRSESPESQVGRILAELDIKPHRVRAWLARPDDSEFWERAADVCGLYLSPPQNALVLSVDEKTAVQARSRKHPTRPTKPGRPERQEFEYRRHGTASFIAALDVATGEVLAQDVDRNTAVNFIGFLEDIDQMVDPLTGDPSGPRQRGGPCRQSHQNLAGGPSPVRDTSPSQTRLLAKPGGAVLLHSHPPTLETRRVQVSRRPHRAGDGLHPGTQQESKTVPLNLRRHTPQSSMTTRVLLLRGCTR